MARHLSVGIDLGTQSVKVIIAEEVESNGRVVPKTVGVGIAETKGLNQGYIVNAAEASRSVRIALDKAEKAAGVTVKRAVVSVGGIGLGSVVSTGSVAISRADLEVTHLDIESAQDAAEAAIPQPFILNRKVINTIPLLTLLDGKSAMGRIEGMKAGKLEMKMLFITCLEHHLDDLIRVIEGAGVEVVDVVAAPIAASFVTLSKKQKKAGCALLNFGAETLSVVVFENSNPVSLEVFETGGGDLTNDIALGFKISLEEAESVKLGSWSRSDYPKKKFDDIISRRLSDCFELVNAHLKKIGRQALLPAGVVLTGGASGLPGLRDYASEVLKLPAKIGEIHFGDEEKFATKDLPWSVAYGLAIFGFNADNEQGLVGARPLASIAEGSRKGLRTIGNWFSKFLP